MRIPPPGERAEEGLEGYVSGWGVTENSTTIVSQLYYAPQSFISNEVCESLYGSEVVIEATLCAEALEGDQTPCNVSITILGYKIKIFWLL